MLGHGHRLPPRRDGRVGDVVFYGKTRLAVGSIRYVGMAELHRKLLVDHVRARHSHRLAQIVASLSGHSAPYN